MLELSKQQSDILAIEGDVFVTACPGSGKTRLLTAKIISFLKDSLSRHDRVAAVTFTNRAAGEIGARLSESGLSRGRLWTGTIHSFALEWLLRPYGSYIPELKAGFTVADETLADQVLDEVKQAHGVKKDTPVRTGYRRDGSDIESDEGRRKIVRQFRSELQGRGLIDFDSVLFMAFSLLKRMPHVAATIASVFKLVCVDEYQDTQDLQFGILGLIIKASGGKSCLFIVGDQNQAIYTSLGGLAKTIDEVRHEFDRPKIAHRHLTGNYRSTQRIVDFCGNFCPQNDDVRIESLAHHSAEPGLITFENQTIHRDDLPSRLAAVVRHHLVNGTKKEDICILGPAWWALKEMGQNLVVAMPDVDIDSPGLSPLPYQPDSFWFKLARLFLSEPSPPRFRARNNWAGDLVSTLEVALGRELREEQRSARSILRLINRISSVEVSGLEYLDDVFAQFFRVIDVDLANYPALNSLRDAFFDRAEARLIDGHAKFESVQALRGMFRFPSGVVVNTCHGVKGEEYDVIICFGLLRGYVPHWSRVFDIDCDDSAEAHRLLYVVASRAKRYLHLFSESGRATKGGRAYETTHELAKATWKYNALPK